MNEDGTPTQSESTDPVADDTGQGRTDDRRRFAVNAGSTLRVMALLVAVATLTTLLLTPRPVAPRSFPLPEVDEESLARLDARELERATQARQNLLPSDVRLVGELYRRVGAALARSKRPPRLLQDLRDEVTRLVTSGRQAELLRLRALQSQLFVEAVEDWRASGEPSDALRELGGDFAEVAKRNWTTADGEFVLDPAELRLLFRARWGRLTGTHRVVPFGPSLEEFRHYYGLYLHHPATLGRSDPSSRAIARLGYVDALSEIDPNYPADLARGILLLTAGERAKAAAALRRHLAKSPSGPWTFASRNYLTLAELR